MNKKWESLQKLSDLYYNPNLKNFNSTQILFDISKIITDLILQHDMEFSEIELELRSRNFNIWIFADLPSKQYKCRNVKNLDQLMKYSMSVCFGNKSYFENNDLKKLGLTYEENFALLNQCGVLCID